MNKKFPVSLLLISYLFISVNASPDTVDGITSTTAQTGHNVQTAQTPAGNQHEAVTSTEHQQPNVAVTTTTLDTASEVVTQTPNVQATVDTAQAGKQLEAAATVVHDVQHPAPAIPPSPADPTAGRQSGRGTTSFRINTPAPEAEPAKPAVDPKAVAPAKPQDRAEVIVVQPASVDNLEFVDEEEDDEDDEEEDVELEEEDQQMQPHPEQHVHVQEVVVKEPEAKKCGGKDCKDKECEEEDDEDICSGCGMPGYFIFKYKTTILLKQIKTTRAFEYYVALVSLFAISLFPFMLKSLRVIIVKMINRTPSKFNYTLTMLVSLFFSLAIVTIDYGLMLVAMTFNVGYFFAIIGGLSLSYSIFGQILESPCHCKSSAVSPDCCC